MTPSAPQPAGPADSVDLSTLLQLFYANQPQELATFESVAGSVLPPAYRQLLDHDSHMTIAVEAFHQSPVDVRVQRTLRNQGRYSREIVLVARNSGKVVQYGIVRLRPDQFQRDVWEQIQEGETPLGQVLIQHNVFRQVELIALWKVTAGPALSKMLEVAAGTQTYGRTARIFCDGEPAIELLEIVAPV
jgi:chorismate-pyruvate lyase